MKYPHPMIYGSNEFLWHKNQYSNIKEFVPTSSGQERYNTNKVVVFAPIARSQPRKLSAFRGKPSIRKALDVGEACIA